MAEVGLVLDARAAVRQEDAAVGDVALEGVCDGVRHHVQLRRDDEAVLRQVRRRRHHVHVHAGAHERAVVAPHRRVVRVAGEARLDAQRPDAVVVIDHGDPGNDGRAFEFGHQRMELPCGPGRLAVAPERFAIMSEQAVPVLLPARRTGAPPEPELALRPMGELLIGDLADLARPGIPAEGAASAGTCRLFHDPEVLSFEAPHHVGGGRCVVRHAGRSPDRVVVPAYVVEVLGQVIIVQVAEKAHEVVRDEVVRTELAQDAHLVSLETHVEVGEEPLPVQAQARIVAVRVGGDLDLTPSGMDMTPEMGPPTAIELHQSAVPASQPVLELRPARVAETDRMAELIVRLPSDHVGRSGEVLRHCPGYAFGQHPVRAGREAVVLAHAPSDARAVQLRGERLRILARHPGGHRSRGRAQNGGDPVTVQYAQRFVEPAELEPPLFRLHVDPGELRQTDDVETGVLHEAGVRLPPLAGPVFRVVISSDVHNACPLLAGATVRVAPTPRRRI